MLVNIHYNCLVDFDFTVIVNVMTMVFRVSAMNSSGFFLSIDRYLLTINTIFHVSTLLWKKVTCHSKNFRNFYYLYYCIAEIIFMMCRMTQYSLFFFCKLSKISLGKNRKVIELIVMFWTIIHNYIQDNVSW